MCVNPHAPHFNPDVFKANAKKKLLESEIHMRNLLAAYTFLSEYKQAQLEAELALNYRKGVADLDSTDLERTTDPVGDCDFYLWNLRYTLIEGIWYFKLIAAQAAVPTQFILSSTAPPEFIRYHLTVKINQLYKRAMKLNFEQHPRNTLKNAIKQDILPYVERFARSEDFETFQKTLNTKITELFDNVRGVSSHSIF